MCAWGCAAAADDGRNAGHVQGSNCALLLFSKQLTRSLRRRPLVGMLRAGERLLLTLSLMCVTRREERRCGLAEKKTTKKSVCLKVHSTIFLSFRAASLFFFSSPAAHTEKCPPSPPPERGRE